MGVLDIWFKDKKNELSEGELVICRYIQDLIIKKGGDIDLLRFQKQSDGYVAIRYFYDIIKFKLGKKQQYIIIDEKIAEKLELITVSCSKSEGENSRRYEFEYASDLGILSDYIFSLYIDTQRRAECNIKRWCYDQTIKDSDQFPET